MTTSLPLSTAASSLSSTAGRRRPPQAEAADESVRADATVGLDPLKSFELFYAQDRERIGRAIAFALGEADLAAEATDEAFVRAYERWSTVSLGNPPAWVYRVAMNWATSVLRRRRTARKHLYAPLPAEVGMVEPAVHEALAALDPKHRSVVVCRYLLGWSVNDTAAALGIKTGTVKSRLSRATKSLQSTLHHLRSDEEQS